jgi:N-acetylglucosaminyldiphosphoundecaprenol N-acetyl-beta-D-mannosaminyltransferase
VVLPGPPATDPCGRRRDRTLGIDDRLARGPFVVGHVRIGRVPLAGWHCRERVCGCIVTVMRNSSSGSSLERSRVFGLAFVDASGPAEVAEALLAERPRLRSPGMLPVVVTPNVDHLVSLDRRVDPDAARVVESARYVLPDGQPVVWASRLLGRPLRSRLAGSEVVALLWPRLVEVGAPVTVIASDEGLAAALRADHPGAVVLVAPWIDRTDADAFGRFADACVHAAVGTDVVFVTIGFPQSERLIGELLCRWPTEVPVPLCCAVGSSFAVLFGHRRRVPRWVARLGLEWTVRLMDEPRRLAGRYARDAVRFPPLLWRERRSARLAGTRRPALG